MEEKRKSFQRLSADEDLQSLEDGKRIYKELKEKYPGNTDEHLDNILNSLCAALICLMYTAVAKDDDRMFSQLVYKILDSNCRN